jgi:hypothetical protein
MLRGLSKYSLGDIKGSLIDYTNSIKLNPEIIESIYQKGICLHSLGKFRDAVKVYEHLLELDHSNHCWYQKEMVLFLHHNLDTNFNQINIDSQLSPKFKEYICKRYNFNEFLISTNYKKQNSFNSKIEDIDLNYSLNDSEIILLNTALKIGQRLQLDSPGFSRNKRQHKMCGFAVLEMSQKLKIFWKNNSLILNGNCSSLQNFEHVFGYRDLMDIAVKWRQISEPNDPVFWIDLLTKEAYEEGFGLQTPVKYIHNHRCSLIKWKFRDIIRIIKRH